MIPLRLQIENFMNHNSSDIDFTQFKSALIVAKNKNNDRESNGIGKTTVFSAIEYAIFGEVPTSTVDKIIRDGSDKCSVTFDFKNSTGTYRIHRQRSKHGRAELKLFQLVNSDWEKMSGTRIPEVEQSIADLIKINYKSFIHSVKFAQNDLRGIASAKKPEERKEILKEPLQLTDYTKLEKIAKEKTSHIRKEIEKIETSVLMLGDPPADVKAAETEISYCDSTIKNKDVTIKKLVLSLDEKKELFEQLKKSLGTDDSKLHEIIASLDKKSKETKSKLVKSNELIQRLSREIKETSEKLTKAQKDLISNQEKLENIDTAQYRDIQEISTELEKVRSDELVGNKLLSRYEVEYDQANKNLPNGDFCSHCLQSITPEHRKKCEDEINKILEEKSKQITITKTNLTKCSNKKSKLQQELDSARKADNEKKVINNNIILHKKDVIVYTDLKNNSDASLFEASKDAEVFQSQLNEVMQSIEHHKQLVQKSEVPEVNAKVLSISDEIKVFERSIENVRVELSDLQKRNGAAIAKLEQGKKNLSQKDSFATMLKSEQKKLKVWNMVVNAFSPKGIPSFIIFTIVDEFQAETNLWLGKLRPELETEFDRELNMKFRVSGQDREYDQLSIGQKVYISLAMKLGLSKVIQKKIGIEIGFLELDEVDQSLDKAGVEAFADAVKKLEENFLVLIVTHNDALKDKFHKAILVEADGKNGACAKVVSSW